MLVQVPWQQSSPRLHLRPHCPQWFLSPRTLTHFILQQNKRLVPLFTEIPLQMFFLMGLHLAPCLITLPKNLLLDLKFSNGESSTYSLPSSISDEKAIWNCIAMSKGMMTERMVVSSRNLAIFLTTMEGKEDEGLVYKLQVADKYSTLGKLKFYWHVKLSMSLWQIN